MLTMYIFGYVLINTYSKELLLFRSNKNSNFDQNLI